MGVQTEFTHQEGFGDISLDIGIPDAPFLQPATVRSDLDETKVSENIGLRYTRVPFTVLFAEGRFAQDRIGQFEQEAGSTTDVFLRDTDYANHQFDCRAGFNTSPWRWLALNAHYRRRDSDSDYDHLRDESPFAGEGYSAFIRHREIVTDEVELKLVLHPALWLKTSLIYRWTDSDYFTATDPIINGLTFPGTLTTGEQLLGEYRANVYGLNVTIAPSPRISFFGTLTYSDSQTVTWAQNEVGSVAPYEGGTWTMMASANYAVNTRTALQAAYMFSRSDYEQNNFAQGLPLGLDYAAMDWPPASRDS